MMLSTILLFDATRLEKHKLFSRITYIVAIGEYLPDIRNVEGEIDVALLHLGMHVVKLERAGIKQLQIPRIRVSKL